MRNECMSLHDFNVDGKMTNKTFDTFFKSKLPEANILGDPEAVSRHDDNVFWLTVYNKNETFKCFWIKPSHLRILPKNVF